ncbi:MAG TPA: hypothetical protein VLG16_02295 [Candidatus Saccharimonadales bacterium]|nr:hypothetical protein [Candidatus Saccharimonadales bacterium]
MSEWPPPAQRGVTPRNDPNKKSSLEIADTYLRGEETAFKAASKLSASGPFGKLLAGEILVEDACNKKSYPAGALANAKQYLQATVSSVKRSHDRSGKYKLSRTYETEGARANLRLAQLDILGKIYSDQRLPGKVEAHTQYQKVLALAGETAKNVQNFGRDKSEDAASLKGCLGEMAVFLLAQRAAIKVKNSREWFPMQSTFKEYSGETYMGTTAGNSGLRWNLSIFTQSKRGQLPEKAYKIPVKTGLRWQEIGPVAPASIYVASDLALDDELYVAKHIIEECRLEYHGQQSEAITENLEERTMRLIAAIEE